jgi:hypothetical protein
VREGLTAVIRLVNDLGLEPRATVEPLPEIDEQDVNVATWLHLCPVTFQFDLGDWSTVELPVLRQRRTLRAAQLLGST